MNKIKNKLITVKPKQFLISICIDIAFGCLAYIIALLTLENYNFVTTADTWIIMAISVAITLLSIFVTGSYKIIWRYAGIIDLVRLAMAFIISLLADILFAHLFHSELPLTFVFLYVYFFFTLAICWRMIGKLTIALKVHFGKLTVGLKKGNTLIYGAGYTGISLVKKMFELPNDGYTPVAYVDDNPSLKDDMINGLRVVGGREAIPAILKEYNIEYIVIAINNISHDELRKLYEEVEKYGKKILWASALSDGKRAFNSEFSLKSINYEELLHRTEHTVDTTVFGDFIADKVIMVTGGAGSIGSEICRQVLSYNCKTLIIYDHHENGMFEINEDLKKRFKASRYVLEVGSVRDTAKLEKVMETYKPDVVFHAAAYKHVPMMEISADEAVKNNVFGTRNVMEQCRKSGVKKFILISTDKAVNPGNIMGATKRIAELELEMISEDVGCKTQYAAVRFGNVLGSSGSVIPTFVRQINEGGPITVTHEDMQRYFMTIPEAVRLVIEAGALAKGGEVFVLDMGNPVYIKNLAKDLIKQCGLLPDKDIPIVFTGLRPGEKCFEELQYGSESVDETSRKGIFICKLGKVDSVFLTEKLDELRSAAANGDKEEVEKIIFTIVPTQYRKICKKPGGSK